MRSKDKWVAAGTAGIVGGSFFIAASTLPEWLIVRGTVAALGVIGFLQISQLFYTRRSTRLIRRDLGGPRRGASKVKDDPNRRLPDRAPKGTVAAAEVQSVSDQIQVAVEQIQTVSDQVMSLALAEKARAYAAEAGQATSASADEVEAAISRATGRILSFVQNETRQIEALLALHAALNTRSILPTTRKWAASPDFLTEAARAFLGSEDRTVLECGSGTSTVVLASLAQKRGGHVFALDHEPMFADATRAQLVQHGVADFATVLTAPLVTYELEGATRPFYDLSELGALFAERAGAGLLIVDGPPGANQHLARLPAVPLLHEFMRVRATVLLDDANRDDEREIVRRWVASGLAELVRHDETLEKGMAVLEITG
jgi:hypothetical protein